MKNLILLIIIYMLSGCVVYPSKHLVSPEYSFTFKNFDVSNARLHIGLEPESVCSNGGELEKINSRFLSTEKYSWLKVLWAFPITSSNTMYLCATDGSGKNLVWQTDLYYFGPLEPKDKEFNCSIDAESLVCHEQQI
jgi:hypothetical protein